MTVRKQRETQNLYTGSSDALSFPLTRDLSHHLGDGRGETFFSRTAAKDAAAAYSLRALGSYNEDVVKVRRMQDNTTQDFTASEVSSGQIEQFAIGQDVLDMYNNAEYFGVKETNWWSLQNNEIQLGSDPFTITCDFICTDSFGNNTARVAQSFDGQDFFQFTTSTQFTYRINGQSNQGIAVSPALELGRKYSFEVSRDSSDHVTLKIDGVTMGTNTVAAQNSGDCHIGRIGNFRLLGVINNYNFNNGEHIIAGDGTDASNWADTGSVGGKSPTKIGSTHTLFTGQGIDAFVDTWYDQSGSGNDATQSTTESQPKIVENGSFVTSESGEKTIKFIGSSLSSGSYGGGNFLAANSLASTFSGDNKTISSFLVSSSVENNTNGVMFGFGRSSGDTPKLLGLYHSGGKIGIQFRADDNTSQTHQTTIAYSANTDLLYTIIRPSTTADLIKDGTVGQDDVNVDVGDTTFDRFSIGVLTRTGNALFLNGTISELIIYSKDQGSDRTEIETDINNYYNIYS